jgi:AraC-like DNA-binding protein/ligand-binding sensor protein
MVDDKTHENPGSDMNRESFAIVSDMLLLLHRIYGVHAVFHPAASISGKGASLVSNRPLPCEKIRQSPGLLRKCGQSERDIMRRAVSCPEKAVCHAGYHHLAVPFFFQDRLMGHIIVAPVLINEKDKMETITRVTASVGGINRDGRNYGDSVPWIVSKMVPLSGGRYASLVKFINSVSDGMSLQDGKREETGMSYYHLPVQMPDGSGTWLSFLWIGCDDSPEGVQRSQHQRIYYGFDSQFRIVIKGKTVTVERGQALALPIGARFTMIAGQGARPYYFDFISSVDLSHVYFRPIYLRGKLRVSIQAMKRALENDIEYCLKPETKLVFFDFLLGFAACGAGKNPANIRQDAPMSDSTDRLCRFLGENLARRITLREMASETKTSVSGLAHLFKKQLGVSPYAYHLLLRLEKAKRLLGEGAMPVKNIARNTGFRSIQHFSNVFRSATGRSPKNYRERAAKNTGIE